MKTKIRKAVIGSGVALMTVAGPTLAHAAPPTLPEDPSGGQVDAAWGTLQGWALTIGAPVLFGLTVVGLGVRMLVKWLKRAGRSV